MRRIATALGVLCAALAALIAPASAWAAFGPASSPSSFGGPGAANGFFNHPQSVAVNGGGEVYVVDSGNARIQRFEADGTFINAFAPLVPTDFAPQDVAISPTTGNVYVASPHRINVFNTAGIPLVVNWEPPGTAYGIAVDADGNVHVGDVTNSQINKYGPLGNLLATYSGPGSTDGKVQQPKGLTTGPSNRIYVADPSNARIQSFQASNGAFVAKFDMPSYTVVAGGATFAGRINPQDVAVDGSGRVFAPDTGIHSNLVAVLTSGGTVEQIFGSPDSDPGNPCQLRGPWGLSTSPSGALYVVSTGENRVRLFNESSAACPAPNFGQGGGVTGPGLPAPATATPLGPDTKKPKIKLSGFPRGRCARHNFQFKVRLRDDVQIQRFSLFVNREKVASNEIGRPDFIFKVNVPVVKVARQIPRGLAGRVLIGVRATDASGKKAKAKRDFLICGTK
jgi:hypothetical protein